MYAINTENGYICSVVKGVNINNANATEEEYLKIKGLLENAPISEYKNSFYKLKEDLTWELYIIEEEIYE